MESYIVDKCG